MGVGSQLRDARIAAGLTIAEVAARSGISSGYISQLERDLANPSIGALDALAKALNVRLRTFFSDGSESEPGAAANNHTATSQKALIGLVRLTRRKHLVYPGSNIRHELLCPDLKHATEILQTTAPPHTDSGDTKLSHEGEECAIVLRGRMEFFLGDDAFILDAGDSIYFDSTAPHSWRNDGDEELEVIWVITPPSF